VPIAEQLKQRSGNLVVEDLHKSLRPVRYSLPNQAQAPLSSVTVSWSVYDQSQGIVKWTFTNDGSQKESVILLRNGYYFGGAFAPVYLANSTPLCSACPGGKGFGVSWIYTEPTQGGVSLVNGEIPPLMDYGSPEENSPPVAPVQFSNGQWLNFAFIFTLIQVRSGVCLKVGSPPLCLPTLKASTRLAWGTLVPRVLATTPNE